MIDVKSYVEEIILKKAILLILSACFITFGIGTSSVSADKSPDIRTQFDVNNMQQYSNADLTTQITLTHFYVKDVHKDKLGDYHYLLVPTQGSTQYFLMVSDSKVKKAKVGHTVSLSGILNGKGVVNMGYKTSPYQHKRCVLFEKY